MLETAPRLQPSTGSTHPAVCATVLRLRTRRRRRETICRPLGARSWPVWLCSRSFGAASSLAQAAAPQAKPAKSYGVRTIAPIWVPVRGGLKLAGRLWLPDGVPGERFPVVFEYIPYRTHDSYRLIDDHWGPRLAPGAWLRPRGHSRLRQFRRPADDEYLASEQQDGAEVIAWLARQPWCNGNVGMRGLSWGGFATLQVAALAPPALKAIMPMCATDMRFWNDAHYVGGAPGLTNLKWAAGFEMVMSGPPDPAVVGDRWEAMWRAGWRIRHPAARWLSHQSNDAYWRHGSVGLDPGAIKCPVYLVDGWADPYAPSAERLLRAIQAPKKALFGPWGHIYPDLARPGPGLAWAQEELRWWRRWLADEETGVMDGPMFRFYMPYATPAETAMQDLPGRWASEPAWPSPAISPRTLYLAPRRLQAEPPSPTRLAHVADQIVGLTTPEWIPTPSQSCPRTSGPTMPAPCVRHRALAEDVGDPGHPRAEDKARQRPSRRQARRAPLRGRARWVVLADHLGPARPGGSAVA